MYLEQIRLENFRCYENIEINFDSRLSLLVGGNGAGKTAILEGASIALSTMFSALDIITGQNIHTTDACLKAFHIGDTDDIQAQYPVKIYARGYFPDSDDRDGEKEWTRTVNAEGGKTTIKDAKQMTEFSRQLQNKLRTGDQKLILPLIAYYGTGRLWDYHREKRYDAFKKNTRTNGYIDSLDGTANIKLMLNWFKKKTIEKYQKQEQGLKPGSTLDIVYQAMEECYAKITGYRNIKIQYNLNTNEIDVYYTDQSGTRMCIPLNQLSDGYKSTISLIADIAYRMANLNPQLMDETIKSTPGIILIDEIDLHLHPEWQHRILGDLQNIFPEVQFIVSTHAPAVISSVRSENLIILRNYRAYKVDSQIYGNDANSILKEIMNVSERTPEIAKLFQEFYLYLNEKKYNEAEQILDRIDEKRNSHDAELANCRVKLKLERLRGGRV